MSNSESKFGRKHYAIAVQQLSPLKEQMSSLWGSIRNIPFYSLADKNPFTFFRILKLLYNNEMEQLRDKWCTHSKENSSNAAPKDGIMTRNISRVFTTSPKYESRSISTKSVNGVFIILIGIVLSVITWLLNIGVTERNDYYWKHKTATNKGSRW